MRPRDVDTPGPSRCLEPQLPTAVPLVEKRVETPRMASLFFPHPDRPVREGQFDARTLAPGQFVMLWLPGVDEKPYAVSYCEGERFGVTVMKRGPFSTALHELGPGALVGFRGPYGRGFWNWEKLTNQPGVVLIGGGCGMAPLALLAKRLPNAAIVQGAATAEDLLYRKRFAEQVLFTEDGSEGTKGLPTEWLREALKRSEVRAVYGCGPEAMLCSVVEMCRAEEVPCQVSLERYMKCGIGVCGQCECNGRLVCQDGPVFSEVELREMPSFGEMTRLATGEKVPVSGKAACATKPPDKPEK